MLVSTRALGRRRPLLEDVSVPPPPGLEGGGGDDLRLRDVIEHVVRHEVEEFERRARSGRFDRVLTAGAIEAAAGRGKVDPAGRERRDDVDPDVAVGAALQAFEDGLYLVFIDDVERHALDEPVHLTADSALTFVRLTMLAGA